MSNPAIRNNKPVRSGTLPFFFCDLASTSHLLSPETILPEQFHDRSVGGKRASGEVALMRAILEDAVNCFQQQFVKHGPRVRQLAKEAERWLFTDDEHWPFSFVNICAVVGLNATYVRQGLRRARSSSDACPTERGQNRLLRRSFPVTT
ncbi:MAG: hypothetical protein HOP18_11380 [Deltaproteobacteria bacterium]|nr:hypothetical protein [Deltaproteobacteria bacterium]